ncbi:hypothetical protein BDP27DRAFT_1362390 [Rhodocollybia butyracea]|uniref:Uncharacterized protein n=1 Tax=Rhodocollybia butyracea TaxID=206335 RepID=A0A9P5PWK6_9AGAR|nr:hypothetical protein BDP27DRAFT_1362390 [Rhodocollybia butyracea]
MNLLPCPFELCYALDEIRRDNWAQLGIKYTTIETYARARFPLHWILSLALMDEGAEPTEDQILAIQLCLLVFYTMRGQEVPKILQLKAALVSVQRNSLVVAGTGFGKTHIMALLMLLENSELTKVFITISALKRLQATQVTLFLLKYSIKTVSINHDMPKDIEYWWTNIHDGRKGLTQLRTALHLIVTAEQLFKSSEGHLTQFACYLCNHTFQQGITHVNINEAHFVHYIGMERFGIPAFCSAWGRFSELKMTLPKTVCWHGFTATCPPHIQATLEMSLLGLDYSLLQIGTINQPTIVYACHCVVKSFQVFKNFLCFL